jgi:hypothetical protein
VRPEVVDRRRDLYLERDEIDNALVQMKRERLAGCANDVTIWVLTWRYHDASAAFPAAILDHTLTGPDVRTECQAISTLGQ